MSPVRLMAWSLAATCALGGMGVGYFLWKPAPLPVAAVAQARRAYVAALGHPGVQPADLARADSLSLEMETRFAAEKGRLVRYRRPIALERTAAALLAVAAQAESVASALRDGQLNSLQERRANLELRLGYLSGQVAAMPGAKKLNRAFQESRRLLGGAQVLEALGDPALLAVQLDSAAVALDRSEELLDRRTGRLHDPGLRSRWQGLVDATLSDLPAGGTAVFVDKLNRRCVVMKGRRVVARFPAELGRNGLADKLFAGDGATPEGRYRVTRKNPDSRYDLALLLDYPNAEDLAAHREAVRSGQVPRGTGPGGLIEIHGHGGRGIDWTEGCIALEDADMAHLFGMIEVGTPVTIVGTAEFPGK